MAPTALLTNGVILGATVTDSSAYNGGYNLAFVSGTTTASIQALPSASYTALPVTGGSATVNYIVTSSTGLTGNVSANAILIVGTTSGVTINNSSGTNTLSAAEIATTGGSGTSATIAVTTVALGSTESDILDNASSSLTISSIISSTTSGSTPIYSLTIGGTGTLALSGTNTYTGPTSFDSGTLILGAAAGAGTGALNVYGGTILASATITVANNIALNTGGGAFIFGGTGALTLSGVISGAGSAIVNLGSTTNTLTYAGGTANSYSGTTMVDTGILILGKTAAVAALAGPVVIGDGVGGANADIVRMATTSAQTLAQVTVNSSGELDLATNNLSATIGALILDGGNVATGTGTLTLGNNLQTLAASTAATITGNLALNGNRTFNIAYGGAATGDLQISAVISGGNELSKMGGGTLVFNGGTANTYSGQTTVDEGTLQLSETAPVAAFAGPVMVGDFSGTDKLVVTTTWSQTNSQNIFVNSSGIFDISSSGAPQSVGTIEVRGGKVIANSNADQQLAFGASNTGGTFTLTFNGQTTAAITYSTTPATLQSNIQAGLGALPFVGSASNVTVNANSNGTVAEITFIRALAGLNLPLLTAAASLTGGTNTITITAGLTIGATITGLADSGTSSITGGNILLTANTTINTFDTITGSGTTTPALTISPVLEGAFTVTKAGSGTLTLNGTYPNIYTGATTVNAGTLQLNDSGGLAIPANLIIGDFLGGSGSSKADVVRLLANNQILSTAVVTINNSGLLDLNGFNNTVGVGAVSGLVMVGGTLSTGTGTLTLGGNVAGQANVANITPATINGNLSLGGGTRFFDVQLGALVTENPNITVPDANDMVVNAVILNGANSAGLTKNNTGALQLLANNTYTGTTTVNAGQLLVDGTQTGSAITVNAGGTLGGIGSTGALTVVTGGLVNPGDPIATKGTLTATSADFSGGGTLLIQASGLTAGTYDKLNVTGNLKLGGTSTLTADLTGLATIGTVTGIVPNAAGITGTFATFNAINVPQGLTAAPTYTAHRHAHRGEPGLHRPVDPTGLYAATDEHDRRCGHRSSGDRGGIDQNNNLVTIDNSTVTIALGANPGTGTLGGTLTVQMVNGIATFSTLSINKAGNGYTLTASDGSLTSATSNTFNITAGAADHVVFLQQPTNTTAGQIIPVTVQVVDLNGNVVTTDNSNVTISIGNNPSGGALGGTATVAANAGVATFTNLSITTAGNGYTLVGVDGSLGGAPSNSFNITPAAPNHLAFGVQIGTTTAGVSISPAVTVQILDQYGNLETTNTTSVMMFLGANPGGSTLSGTTSMAAVGGIATFTDLSLNKTGSGYMLLALDGSLIGALSNTFTIVPAAAAQVAFNVQPGNTMAGTSISPAVTVQVIDGFGNVVTSDNTSQVVVALGANPGGGTLSGTLTMQVTSGVASFGNLSINKTGTGYTLTATDGSLTGATSNTFNITPNVANYLGFGVQPTNTVAGVAIAPAVTVKVFDNFGNLVTGDTSNVTVALGANPGSGTLSGTLSVAAVGGIASFGTLSINVAANGYTLSAIDGSLTGTTSSTFNITAAAANHLVFFQEPSNALAGALSAPRWKSRWWTSSATWLALILPALPCSWPRTRVAAPSAAPPPSAVAGIATFPNLTLNKVGGGYTLAALDGSLGSTVSSSFSISPNVAKQLVFFQQPTNAQAGSPLTPAVTVDVLDQWGNVVTSDSSNVTVALGANPGSGSLGGTLTEAAINGVATFSDLSVNKVGNGYTLNATDGTLTATTSNQFNISPGAAFQLGFSVQPSNTGVGLYFNPTVTVQVLDQFGNLVTSDSSHITIQASETIPAAARSRVHSR